MENIRAGLVSHRQGDIRLAQQSLGTIAEQGTEWEGEGEGEGGRRVNLWDIRTQGEACAFSSHPLHTWCGLGTQGCRRARPFKSRTECFRRPWAAHCWKGSGMLTVCRHWHRGPLGVGGQCGRGFGDCTRVHGFAECLARVGSKARRPRICYFL